MKINKKYNKLNFLLNFVIFTHDFYKLFKKIRIKVNFWACSSVVERYVDIVEVISSILITPTKIATIFYKRAISPIYFNSNNNIKHCLVIIAKGLYPIPFRTRKSSPSAPMVLCLKTRESRTLPGLI